MTAGGRRKIAHRIIADNKIKLLELEKCLLCFLPEVIFFIIRNKYNIKFRTYFVNSMMNF